MKNGQKKGSVVVTIDWSRSIEEDGEKLYFGTIQATEGRLPQALTDFITDDFIGDRIETFYDIESETMGFYANMWETVKQWTAFRKYDVTVLFKN